MRNPTRLIVRENLKTNPLAQTIWCKALITCRIRGNELGNVVSARTSPTADCGKPEAVHSRRWLTEARQNWKPALYCPGSKKKVQIMTVAEEIVDHVRKMPEPERVEVLDFIEYLETKARQRRVRDEEERWSALSLASALRGQE